MPITVSAKGLRRKEDTAPGKTSIVLDYKKMDARVATLRVSLLSSTGTVISSTTIDVSAQATRTTATYAADLTNNLDVLTVPVSLWRSDTLPANSSKSYSPVSGQIFIITVSGGEIKDANGKSYGTIAVVSPLEVAYVYAGASGATVDVFDTTTTSLPSTTFTLKVEELDSAGNVLYTMTTSIYDYPPILTSQA